MPDASEAGENSGTRERQQLLKAVHQLLYRPDRSAGFRMLEVDVDGDLVGNEAAHAQQQHRMPEKNSTRIVGRHPLRPSIGRSGRAVTWRLSVAPMHKEEQLSGRQPLDNHEKTKRFRGLRCLLGQVAIRSSSPSREGRRDCTADVAVSAGEEGCLVTPAVAVLPENRARVQV
jgi:hypothetical protein